MKGTFKLFTLAVAVAALASCSNDDFERATFSADKAELTGTLGFAKGATRSGMQEAAGYGSEEIVWTKGDKARVFTLDQLTYNAYTLVGGENTQVGKFTSESGNVLSGDKYAVTDASMVYALSADNEARPLLTMTIPSSYEVDQELMGEGIYKFPAPFWGKVNQEKDNGDGTYDLNVTFMPLIAYLRVDLANLPLGTKAIVLTTHGGQTAPTSYYNSGKEGFQLFSKQDLQTYNNHGTLENWIAAYNSGLGWVEGGKSEPLSGTLNAVLSDEDFVTDWEDPAYDPASWPALGFDERLVSSDTLRIDLAKIQAFEDEYGEWSTENGNQIFWVPIVAQYYKDLHVIAVTEDTPLSYQWVGKELKCWSDQTFVCNDIWDLSQATLDMAKYKDYFANPNYPTTTELSEVLWLEGKELADEGMGRTLTVDVPNIVMDGPLFIDRELTDNNITLYINNLIPSTGNSSYTLQVVEAKGEYKVNHGQSKMNWQTSAEMAPAPSKRTLTIINNYMGQAEWRLGIIAPTSKVVLDGNAYQNVGVRAASDKYVSGHALVPGSNHMQNATDGALIVKSSVYYLIYGNFSTASMDLPYQINSYAQTADAGDVYIYAGGNEESIINNLIVYGSTEGSKEMAVRLTDALVYNIEFPNDKNCKRTIYTTGSTAIKSISQNSPDDVKNLLVQSFWTGAALTDKAIELGFDQEQIYTAAQLASVGEKTQAKYQINKYVEGIWLGGPTYPWIGAQVTVDKFEFDGNKKSLRNMTLETDNTTFVDPHHCCTSCGPVHKLKLDANLGLFRSIINETYAEIENVNLNDVKLVTDAPIDNIGSIAGYVETKELTLTFNRIGEVKMDVNGNNIGGMIGNADIKGKVTMSKNTVGGSVNNSGYIISKLANVGGQIGLLQAEGEVNIQESTVNFDDKKLGTIQGGGESRAEWNNRQDEVQYIPSDMQDVANVPLSFVGGIAGIIYAKDDVKIQKSKVNVANEIKARGSYVGGIAGGIQTVGREANLNLGVNWYSGSDVTVLDNNAAVPQTAGGVKLPETKDLEANINNTVTVGSVISEEGSFAAGGVGLADIKGGVSANNNKIVVDDYISTYGDALQGSFAAGLFGYLEAEGAQACANIMELSKIRAYGKNAAGLIGLSQTKHLRILNNKVSGATFRADEGFVGGLIGTIQTGRTKFGCNFGYKANNVEHHWNSVIDIENLKGAMAVGGVVGDNQAELRVYAFNQYDDINIDAIKYKTTKDATWYRQDNNHELYAGTMANVLGYLQQPVEIYDKYLKTTAISKNMKKKDMLFPEHVDEQHTQESGLWYFGDKKDYIGWGISGNYNLNGEDVWADQDYNWYIPKADYHD